MQQSNEEGNSLNISFNLRYSDKSPDTSSAVCCIVSISAIFFIIVNKYND